MKYRTHCKFILTSLTILFALDLSLYSQNCSNDSSGLTPITDLADGFYQGYQGGLYFGSNKKPAEHSDNLNNAILKIKPLNTMGNPDGKNGKIVLLSIGASNPKTEFESFQAIADTFSLINPNLEIVNGCQGGKGLQKILDTTDNYWQNVNKQLTVSGVTRNQVQIIWLEEENTQSNNVNFPDAPLELMVQFKDLFKIFLQNFPNLQICYLTARGYAGYVDDASNAGKGLRQPRDYYHGWAMKWLIENQISGDTTLSFTGPNKKAPVLDWSAYLWADGINQRKDGLSWICPTDVKTDDGLHWSPAGNDKAGSDIFRRFYADKEARKWFVNNIIAGMHEVPAPGHLSIYPNPCDSYIQIKTDIPGRLDAWIYNNLGHLVIMESNFENYCTINHNLPSGIYYLMLKTENYAIVSTTKMIVSR